MLGTDAEAKCGNIKEDMYNCLGHIGCLNCMGVFADIREQRHADDAIYEAEMHRLLSSDHVSCAVECLLAPRFFLRDNSPMIDVLGGNLLTARDVGGFVACQHLSTELDKYVRVIFETLKALVGCSQHQLHSWSVECVSEVLQRVKGFPLMKFWCSAVNNNRDAAGAIGIKLLTSLMNIAWKTSEPDFLSLSTHLLDVLSQCAFLHTDMLKVCSLFVALPKRYAKGERSSSSDSSRRLQGKLVEKFKEVITRIIKRTRSCNGRGRYDYETRRLFCRCLFGLLNVGRCQDMLKEALFELCPVGTSERFCSVVSGIVSNSASDVRSAFLKGVEEWCSLLKTNRRLFADDLGADMFNWLGVISRESLLICACLDEGQQGIVSELCLLADMVLEQPWWADIALITSEELQAKIFFVFEWYKSVFKKGLGFSGNACDAIFEKCRFVDDNNFKDVRVGRALLSLKMMVEKFGKMKSSVEAPAEGDHGKKRATSSSCSESISLSKTMCKRNNVTTRKSSNNSNHNKDTQKRTLWPIPESSQSRPEPATVSNVFVPPGFVPESFQKKVFRGIKLSQGPAVPFTSRVVKSSAFSRTESCSASPEPDAPVIAEDALQKAILQIDLRKKLDIAGIEKSHWSSLKSGRPGSPLSAYQLKYGGLVISECLTRVGSWLTNGPDEGTGGFGSEYRSFRVGILDISRRGGSVRLKVKPDSDQDSLVPGDLVVITDEATSLWRSPLRIGGDRCLLGVCESTGESRSSVKNGERRSVFVSTYLESISCPNGLSPQESLVGCPGYSAIVIGCVTPMIRDYQGVVHMGQSPAISGPISDVSLLIRGLEAPKSAERYRQKESSKLNDSQVEAVCQALGRTRGITLLQGPPGSGKTSVGVDVIKCLREQALKKATTMSDECPPLVVCAPSNSAVDELCSRFMIQHGDAYKCVRVGHVARITRDCVRAVSLELMVSGEVRSSEEASRGRYLEKKSALYEQCERLEEVIAFLKGQGQAIGRTISMKKEVKEKLTKLKNEESEEVVGRRDAIRRRILMKDCDVVFSTLSGLGAESVTRCLTQVDSVVVDEAAQALEMSLLIPLRYSVSRMVLIGDPMQLPATVKSARGKHERLSDSLFARMAPAHVMLNRQYRMAPEVSLFPRTVFYNGELLDDESVKGLDSSLLFINVHAPSAVVSGASIANAEEGRIIRDVCLPVLEGRNLVSDVGIVAPYRRQIHLLRELCGSVFSDVHVDTVDAFQGREKEVMILSCVRSSPSSKSIGFVADPRRLNVAITRAKRVLWIVGDAECLSRGSPTWKLLVDNCRERRILVNISEVNSVERLTAFLTSVANNNSE